MISPLPSSLTTCTFFGEIKEGRKKGMENKGRKTEEGKQRKEKKEVEKRKEGIKEGRKKRAQ